MAPTEPRKQLNHKQADPPLPGDSNKNSAKKERENATTWYMKSWPRKSKAPPITEVARESISATNPILSERNRSNISLPRSSRSQSIAFMKKGRASTRSLPADVTTTRLNIASTGSSPALNACDDFPSIVDSKSSQNGTKECSKTSLAEAKAITKINGKHDLESQLTGEELPKSEPTREPTLESISDSTADHQPQESVPNRSSGWFGWLARSTVDADGNVASENPELPQNQLAGNEPDNPPTETEQNSEAESEIHTEPTANPEQDIGKDTTVAQIPATKATSLTASQKRSWLYMWTGNPTASPGNSTGNKEATGQDEHSTDESITKDTNQTLPNQPDASSAIGSETGTTATENSPEKDAPKSTSWLFWSRERQETGLGIGPGEVNSPLSEPAHQTVPELLADKTNTQAVQTIAKTKPKKTVKAGSTGSAKGVAAQLSTSECPPEPAKQQTSTSVKQIGLLPNHVLPSFENTFPVQDRPGIFQQLGRLIYYGKGPEPKHVLRTQHRPQIKKALAIGIHGYFPAPLIRNIIGQPTGTSIKFATMAEQAILEWAAHHETPCQVEKIVLEGEGRISERVDLLWKLLLNWIDHVRTADFIMVSCHSQGVPVATMLVAKLIAFGCVSSARIGICAMAGVNLGPFPDYRSRWISGSAGELFDFASADSKVSQDYMAALEAVLEHGVRITYVGSIDDQLVSLESSVFATISHPYICRAVFVDGRVHAPSFVSHLVGFAMKLRNLGIYDHGLLRELSSPLAGSLYSGEGHSRLYDDTAVYRLAVQFTLETTSIPPTKPQVHALRTSSPANPYILPFAMRGVLEEEFVRRELSEETAELLKQFDDWKPSTKVLKDVKFRLEGIRSKL